MYVYNQELLVDCLVSLSAVRMHGLMCTGCTDRCRMCYFDSNGNNICRFCEEEYMVTNNGLSCQSMFLILSIVNRQS